MILFLIHSNPAKIKISIYCYIEKTNTPAVGISVVPISALPPFGKLNV